MKTKVYIFVRPFHYYQTMNLHKLGHSFLKFCRRFLYRGPIKTFVRRSFVGSALHSVYWHGIVGLTDQRKCDVDGAEARFRITSKREYERTNHLSDEEPVISDILSHVCPSDTFYDVGANIGIYTCLIGSQLQSGTVVAFEPHPRNLMRLRENVDINGIDGRFLGNGLSDVEEISKFRISTAEIGDGKSALTFDDGHGIDIHAIPGDLLVKRELVPTPDVLKIDIEGAELRAIRGLRNTLTDDVRVVYCEVHPEQLKELGDDPEMVEDELNNCGFEIDVLHRRNDTHFLRGVKT